MAIDPNPSQSTKNGKVIVVMPPDLIEEIKQRTSESQRSMNKEIVWILMQFLKQEKKETQVS